MNWILDSNQLKNENTNNIKKMQMGAQIYFKS